LRPRVCQLAIKMSQAATKSSDYLKKKHAHASQLEDELAMLPPKTSESKKAALRVKLCELYSDMLLHDPHYASRKDCLNRLWRNCFYGHISELRSRLSKEQKRKGSKVAEISRSYTSFLAEAITLYDYLVREYTEKLTSEVASSQSTLSGAHVSSQDSEAPPTPTTSTLGVVNNLFRMYIHMGDLHRYSKDNDAADKAYLKASKLAPGKGNPYNQMAVVAALRETGAPLSCVAFYYYSRSLLAVDDPFETSRTNLLKLLEQNRVWLKQNPIDMIPTGNSSKKAALELQRLKKSASSKRCLANFVDLHYDFVDTMNLSELEVIQKFSKLLDTFQELVAISAFGDALLMKMVAINAYSITSGKEFLARTFTLRFGTVLGEKLVMALAKTTESQKTKEPSLRLLSPFMLLADYCLSFSWNDIDEISELVATESQEAENAFWTQVAAVANSVQLFSKTDHDPVMPREYESFRGYKPFQGFIDSPEDVYVTAQGAFSALGLNQSQATASTSPDDTRAKLAYFLSILARGEGTKVMRNAVGGYVLDSQTLVEEEDAPVVMDEPISVPEPVLSSPVPSDEELDEAGDVVMYKPSGKDGSGPALLVPGAFFFSQGDSFGPQAQMARPAEELQSETGVDIVSLLRQQATPGHPDITGEHLADPMEEDQPIAPPRQPPGLSLPPGQPKAQKPPPGFAPSMSHEQHDIPRELYVLSTGHYQEPVIPPGFSRSVQPTMYSSLFDYPIQTTNPFYSSPQSDLRHAYIQTTDFLNDADGATFLDKSLLDQLWNDDSPKVSKNPFLT